MRSLRMDDIRDREQRKQLDKLTPIREVLTLFVGNFEKYYIPTEYLTVDKQLKYQGESGKCITVLL